MYKKVWRIYSYSRCWSVGGIQESLYFLLFMSVFFSFLFHSYYWRLYVFINYILLSGAGKTGQPLLKNETRTLSNTIHKNKLKMD